MKKVIYCFLTMMLMVGLIVGCAAPKPAPAPAPTPTPAPAPAPAPQPAKPIVLKMIASMPGTNPLIATVQKTFIDKVNNLAKGELTIQFTGGPEVVAIVDQGIAVQKGTVDMDVGFSLTYEPLAPGAGLFTLSTLSLEQERERGLFELINGLLKPANLFALGRGLSHRESYFYIFTNKWVETPYGLAGQRIGSTPAFFPFTRALGCAPTTVPVGEDYTALQTGLVDGLVTTMESFVSFGSHQVTKYIIDHPFEAPNTLLYMNLNTFNQLPKHLQSLLIQCGIDSDKEMGDFEMGLKTKARQTALGAGVKVIKFSPADADWFMKTGYKGAWDEAFKLYPNVAPKFKELLSP